MNWIACHVNLVKEMVATAAVVGQLQSKMWDVPSRSELILWRNIAEPIYQRERTRGQVQWKQQQVLHAETPTEISPRGRGEIHS